MHYVVYLDDLVGIHPFPVIAGSEYKDMYQLFRQNPLETKHRVNLYQHPAQIHLNLAEFFMQGNFRNVSVKNARKMRYADIPQEAPVPFSPIDKVRLERFPAHRP